MQGKRYALRPTLRAASTLNRRYGGFGQIIEALDDGNLECAYDVAKACIADRQEFVSYAGMIGKAPLSETLNAVVPPILALILNMTGADQDEADTRRKAPKMSFEQYHEELFQIACGWLLWTPDVAWNATPAEILTAYKGRLAMLKAIHGGGEEDTSNDSPKTYDPGELDREGLAALKAMAA
ncbi:MAG: hypothetical protein AB7J19_16715 [Beijerinckiaceae bacterium]